MITKSALDGIKVLDFTRILAGPYCSMLLGDLGAEVIKIERPKIGDDTRSWRPPVVPGSTQSCYFVSVNRNKKSVCIDLKARTGRELVKQMAQQADVVIENFLPGTMKKLGLDYRTLSTKHDRLIYCSISGYGQTGPYANRGGFDVIASAIGGLMHITGEFDGKPCKVGVAMTDLSTGLYAKGAICAALYHRERTGKGQKIDCDLLSTQVASLANIGSNYLNAGWEAKRWGSAHESIVPYQAFETSDGYMVVGAGNDNQFIELCNVLDQKQLTKDPKFATNALRVTNRTEIIELLSDIFKSKSSSNWLDIFGKASCKFPYGPINNIENVFSDPQVEHSDLVKRVQGSEGQDIKMVGPAVTYSETKPTIRRPPPLLGEHTDEVLADVLGLSVSEISELRRDNVVS